MFQDMTDSQIVLIVGSIGNGVLAAWTAYTVYRERMGARAHRELLELKSTEREDKEREHRHRMAEIQQGQLFELEKMNRMVHDAKVVAVETKRDISRKIDESKEDRQKDLKRIEAKVDDNTKKTEAGIDAANHVNEKIAALGLARLTADHGAHAAQAVAPHRVGLANHTTWKSP